jgi:omega-6 fatty acid desaturase (delta-12 desaturase)
MTSTQELVTTDPHADGAAWKAIVEKYQQPHAGRACWQLVNTIGSYLAVWVLLYVSLQVSWLLTVPLAVLAGGLLVRVFIIFHDCGHGSFFGSSAANATWGFLTGILTFTPYYHWRGEHAIHHGSTGHLDRRGVGDVWTMTVQEYLESSRWKRFAYRLARNPFVLFIVAPLVLFLVLQRVPRAEANERERRSVWVMNLAVVLQVVGMCAIFGILPYLVIQLIILMIAGSVGIWLFYMQHQFEDAYWERGDDWDYEAAALQGSSFLKLPRILQWFSGNIGFHHVHHLNPKIPNYNLQRAHDEQPVFQSVPGLSLWDGLQATRLKLWDEQSDQLVTWKQHRA